MKRILITGANSYIGDSVRKYLQRWPESYDIETIDMIDGSWKEKSFETFDVIFHVAGIAHQKETKDNRELYYKVNRDLAIETAKKAKEEGVSLFVFLSSMSVYGVEVGVINENTIPQPNTNYGKSKLQAEEGISKLESDTFSIAIIRPPMIYGQGCKGNYNALIKFANKLPVFPDINNQRSMLRIDTFCEYVRTIVDENVNGIFFPQDEEYVCTSKMVQKIAEQYGKNIRLLKVLNPFVFVAMRFPGRVGSLARKAFGNLIYKMK